MRNFEIKQPIDLLASNGSINQAGYAKTPLIRYNREALPVGKWRMKEWDYYLIFADTFAAAFTLSDLGYIRMASVSYIDFELNQETTRTALASPLLYYFMPDSSVKGNCTFKSRDVDLRFESAENGKHIYCDWKKFFNQSSFKADIWFSNLPDESIVMVTPFEDGKHFYFNQKMVCMPALGKIAFDWHVKHLDPKKNFGILDWGRGWWPYSSHWYWGVGAGQIKGVPFGFNLGYGFGNTSAASENMVFYNGKVHKLDDIEFLIPKNPMDPWQIVSSDGRFCAEFVPSLDRAAKINAGPVSTDQHQYFGWLNGYAVLDHSRKISFQNFSCAFESVYNKY